MNTVLTIVVTGTVTVALAVDVAVVIEWLNTKRRLR
jgi:hypothetical protein